jgi:6-phosphogluconolactonase/glucosamine-6-phosphate isomerase/deaminase
MTPVALRRADPDQPRVVIGIATGSSPKPVYAALAEHVRAGVDAAAVTCSR